MLEQLQQYLIYQYLQISYIAFFALLWLSTQLICKVNNKIQVFPIEHNNTQLKSSLFQHTENEEQHRQNLQLERQQKENNRDLLNTQQSHRKPKRQQTMLDSILNEKERQNQSIVKKEQLLDEQPIILNDNLNKEIIKDEKNDNEFDDNYIVNFQNFTRKPTQKKQIEFIESISDNSVDNEHKIQDKNLAQQKQQEPHKKKPIIIHLKGRTLARSQTIAGNTGYLQQLEKGLVKFERQLTREIVRPLESEIRTTHQTPDKHQDKHNETSNNVNKKFEDVEIKKVRVCCKMNPLTQQKIAHISCRILIIELLSGVAIILDFEQYADYYYMIIIFCVILLILNFIHCWVEKKLMTRKYLRTISNLIIFSVLAGVIYIQFQVTQFTYWILYETPSILLEVCIMQPFLCFVNCYNNKKNRNHELLQ